LVKITEKIILFDFDGVIKDSVKVKTDAFELLFIPYGANIAAKVKNHNKKNSGMSRFDKLPIYLKWAGEIPVEKLIDKFEKRFSNLVKQKVIDSRWVLGVQDYLERWSCSQQFFIITATPQKEIEEILCALEIDHFFKGVIGTPSMKGEAIKKIMTDYKFTQKEMVMIGDSNSDYEAAVENKVSFILRNTELNKKLQQSLICKKIDNFL